MQLRSTFRGPLQHAGMCWQDAQCRLTRSHPPVQADVAVSRRPSLRAQAVLSPARPSVRDARRENVPGDFYVDHTCIDCDTCRWMAPDTFGRVGDMSATIAQPTSQQERQKALHALVSCPTFSIHVRNKQPGEMAAAIEAMPISIEDCPNVFLCGYTSEDSYGASSYLVVRPEGNIMIDSPRFSPVLLKRIKAMGGARYMWLSHKDDVCDHAKWAEALGLERIIHEEEVTRSQGTTACEVQLEGEGPWALPDGADDVEIIFTPGHTSGSMSLLFKPDKALFTGDHLALSASLGRLTIFRRVNWYSVEEQLRSVEKLADVDFLHVLPGHGRRMHLTDAADRQDNIAGLLEREGYKDDWQVGK